MGLTWVSAPDTQSAASSGAPADSTTFCDKPPRAGRTRAADLGGLVYGRRVLSAVRNRSSGRRARDAGLVPGGPEGRWAAEPVMPEPTGTGGTAAYGAVPPAQQDPDVAGKRQLAIPENSTIFSR